jgi:hypothetical protein
MDSKRFAALKVFDIGVPNVNGDLQDHNLLTEAHALSPAVK